MSSFKPEWMQRMTTEELALYAQDSLIVFLGLGESESKRDKAVALGALKTISACLDAIIERQRRPI